MAVKLILLKSGEDIICDLKEMVTEEEKLVGYYLEKPCIVKVKDISTEVKEKENSAKFNIVLYPWIPLSKDKSIPVPLDWVVTIVDPVDKLFDMYKKDVLEYKKDDKGTDTEEQSDTNNEN